MKKVLLATTAIVAFAGVASAQEVSGFLEFEAIYADDIDTADNGVEDLDFVVDGNLSFDYSQSTKAGLEYGMHFELDLEQSDTTPADTHAKDVVEFNDGYVFINSAMGNVSMGDAGSAGEAALQLNVPFLTSSIMEVTDLINDELEVIKYENTFAGFDFSASTDDDGEWALGLGYDAALGSVELALGATVSDDSAAASVGVTSGAISAGVSYAGSTANSVLTTATRGMAVGTIVTGREYVAAGVSYDAGALDIGVGVESNTDYMLVGENFQTNIIVGATYEIADGLILGAGVTSLDDDNTEAKASVTVNF